MSDKYDELLAHVNQNPDDVDSLWQLAEACYRKSNDLKDAKDSEEAKNLILKGKEYGMKAVELRPDGDVQVLKWAAILVGRSTDFLPTKERIKEAYVLKSLLDKALVLNDQDSTLLHLRGRYAYGISKLTWLESKVAAVFFATPPVATVDEALADFLACHAIRPDFIENCFYVAKCYIDKKQYAEAVKFLKETVALTAEDSKESAIQAEATTLIKSHDK